MHLRRRGYAPFCSEGLEFYGGRRFGVNVTQARKRFSKPSRPSIVVCRGFAPRSTRNRSLPPDYAMAQKQAPLWTALKE